jgi:hypothetical protein
LATTDDARVHCAVLKTRAAPPPHARQGTGKTALQRSPAWRPVPSGPNSVPDPSPRPGRRSPPARKNRAGRTSRPRAAARAE